jgi:hypothetical protein
VLFTIVLFAVQTLFIVVYCLHINMKTFTIALFTSLAMLTTVGCAFQTTDEFNVEPHLMEFMPLVCTQKGFEAALCSANDLCFTDRKTQRMRCARECDEDEPADVENGVCYDEGTTCRICFN